MEQKKDFFVSYTSADRQWAEWIAWTLEEAGFSVFLQAWDILPGSNFVQQMRLAAVHCDRTVAVLSNAYLQSVYAESEWNAAFADDPTGTKRKLIPVRIEDCQLVGLDKPIVYVNLIALSEDDAKASLLQGLGQTRAKPEKRPPFPPHEIERQPFPGSLRQRATRASPQIGILSTEFIHLDKQNDLTYEASEFQRALGIEGAVVHLLDPTLLVIGIQNNRPVVGYLDPGSQSHYDINWNFFGALDALIVRRTRASDPTISETIYDLLLFLNEIYPNLVLLDPLDSFHRPLSKIPSILARARKSIHQGNRIIVGRTAARGIQLPFDYPLVAKPATGWRGVDVTECKTKSDLSNYLDLKAEKSAQGEFEIILEEHLQPLAEFRVIVIGGESVGCAQKVAADGCVAANYVKGAKWFVNIDEEAMRLAVQAADAHHYAFAGVDVARIKDGYVIIECNRNPQFSAFDRATGTSVATLMARYTLSQLPQAQPNEF